MTEKEYEKIKEYEKTEEYKKRVKEWNEQISPKGKSNVQHINNH